MEKPCGVYAETGLPVETATKIVRSATTIFEKAHLESTGSTNATNITIYSSCTVCPHIEQFCSTAEYTGSYWEALSKAIEAANDRVGEVKRLDCNRKDPII